MSVEGGSDRQQAGFLIIAAVGFPHGNVTCFLFHLWTLAAVEAILWKKIYFAKAIKSCRHFEAKKCKETYQFSVNCSNYVAKEKFYQPTFE